MHPTIKESFNLFGTKTFQKIDAINLWFNKLREELEVLV